MPVGWFYFSNDFQLMLTFSEVVKVCTAADRFQTQLLAQNVFHTIYVIPLNAVIPRARYEVPTIVNNERRNSKPRCR